MDTAEDFLAWAGPVVARAPEGARRLFAEAAALAGAMRRPGADVRHEFETSRNCRDGDRLVKIGHFFSPRASAAPVPAEGFLEAAAAARWIAAVNAAQGARFDAEAFARLMRVPLSQGRRNDCVGFCADFEPATGAFAKMTAYVNPARPADVDPRLGAAEELERLQFLGVDLFADGGRAVKLYVETDAPPAFSAPAAFRALLGGGRVLLKRDAGPGGAAPGVMFHAGGRPVAFDRLAASGTFRGRARFWEECARTLARRRVTWLAVKDEGRLLEVYFR